MISKFIFQTGWFLHWRMLVSAQRQLDCLPNITLGRHTVRGKPRKILRFPTTKDGKNVRCEVEFSSPKGIRHVQTYKKILFLKRILAELNSDEHELLEIVLRSENKDKIIVRSVAKNERGQDAFDFSLEEWNALVELNDQSIVKGYRYGRHVFRSKSEMIIAQILDALGLEYKYEPIVMLNGMERHPDFAVYCPETGRYFFIEHLGRMADPKYRMDNVAKMELYENVGIRDGIDIVYTTEFGLGSFNADVVVGKIVGILIAQTYQDYMSHSTAERVASRSEVQ